MDQYLLYGAIAIGALLLIAIVWFFVKRKKKGSAGKPEVAEAYYNLLQGEELDETDPENDPLLRLEKFEYGRNFFVIRLKVENQPLTIRSIDFDRENAANIHHLEEFLGKLRLVDQPIRLFININRKAHSGVLKCAVSYESKNGEKYIQIIAINGDSIQCLPLRKA
jgi:hypothetical protein